MLRGFIDWWRDEPWRSISLVSTTLLIAVAVAFLSDGAHRDPATATQGTSGSLVSTATTPAGASPTHSTTETDSTLRATVSREGGLIAVKVDNSTAARPQVGIAAADVLVEVPVEGRITRFVAIYSDRASGLVGPVRSLRPVDADLLAGLASNVVSTGGQPFVLQEVEASGVRPVNALNFEWYVTLGRQPPHDTFVDLDVLVPSVTRSEGDALGLPIGDLPQPRGEVSRIQLPIGSAELRLEGGFYVRHESGQPVEVLTSDDELTPLQHRTAVVISAAERPAGYEDSNDVPVSTFDVIGSGEVMVFSGGSVYSGTWSRSAQADPFVFRDPEGLEFGLPEGSVYLAIAPRGSDLTFGS